MKKHGPVHAGSGTGGAREKEKKKKGRKEQQKQSGRAKERRTSERPQNEQELDRAELQSRMELCKVEAVRTDGPERSRCPPRVEQDVSARASKMCWPGTAHGSGVHETEFACSIPSLSHSCLVIIDVARDPSYTQLIRQGGHHRLLPH